MTKPKHLQDRRPDGRFGKTNYVGPKPSENFDWDTAIQRLRTMLDNLDLETAK